LKYAQIRSLDISNGEGIGIALFVQGCHFHCKNCFNKETWDFESGKEWTNKIEDKFIELADKPHIKRISILGGEPLADENISGVFNLVKKIKERYGDEKTIWLYTGYTWEQIFNTTLHELIENFNMKSFLRISIMALANVLVDGKYIDDLKQYNYPFAGSTNQRIIDIRKTLESGDVMKWI